MIFFSGCKINIGLYVIRKRADGYHDLETVMFPVRGLCDAIEMIPGDKPGVEFSSSGLAVDGPVEKNLCVRAYELMRRNYPIGDASAQTYSDGCWPRRRVGQCCVCHQRVIAII